MRLAAGALVAAAVAALGASGCDPLPTRRHPQASPDTMIPEPPPTGRRSFEVRATLFGPVPSGPPRTFSVTVDADSREVYLGGVGPTAVAAAVSPDGRTFRSAGPKLLLSGGGGCAEASLINFNFLELTVIGNELRGMATGFTSTTAGIATSGSTFTATLVGGPDVTPPTIVTRGASPFDSFSALSVVAMEALAPGATARLVATDGTTVTLAPHAAAGALSAVSMFEKPDVVLAPGLAYSIELDGLVDLSGNEARAQAPLRIGETPAAPLVAEDGFETAIGPTLGGAGVVGAGTIEPLAGTRSLYIAFPGGPAADESRAGPSATLRLALAPGDTTVRFSYAAVSSESNTGLDVAVTVGSVGRTVRRQVLQTQTQFEGVTRPSGRYYLGMPGTMEIPLPADAAGEVLISIGAPAGSCDQGPGLPVGLLIEDLRVE